MANWSAKTSGDREYVASGKWKCEKSPSGAHYWIVLHNQMTCRHCDCVKPVIPAIVPLSVPAKDPGPEK